MKTMKEFDDLKHFIEGLKQLPILSPVALRIVEAADNEDVGIGAITKLIESDQALSSKVLQVFNHLLIKSERQGEVNTVKYAATMLGMNMIRSIALSLIVVNLFKPSSDDTFNIVEFWKHSAACAIISKLFAQRFSYPQPDEAFIAGLLHDLGKLIFFQWKMDKYYKIVTEANTAKARLLEHEEKTMCMGHTHAAKLLMELWRFPQPLINAAWLHHQPISEFGSDRMKQLPFIVKCANSLCHIHSFGNSGNPSADFDLEQIRLATGLSDKDIAQLLSQVLNLFEEVSKIYDWKMSIPDLYLSAVSRANQELFHHQLELKETRQQLLIQQTLNNLIYEMNESLSIHIPVRQALANIVDMLGCVIPYRRIMSFLLMADDDTIEGWFKLNTKSDGERIILPLNRNMAKGLKQMSLREQVSLIEHTVERLGNELNAGPEILKAIHSPNLKVQSMYVGGKTIGLIMIEMSPFIWSQHEKTIFLRKYALAAATALERIIMIESLDQQMEERTQLFRRIDNMQERVYHSEQMASVGRLMAGAAHEINNPLAAISLKAQLLLIEVSDEKWRKALNLILEQTARISKITKDFLELSRPAEPVIEPASIELAINRVLCLLENRIMLHGVKVVKEFGSNVPLVNADSKQMDQVFLNLTINAIQAMSKGGVLTIRVNIEHKMQRIRIEFNDTGSGIEPENISRLFDPFYTSKKDGHGLGLAICRSIIESHNGEITVASQPCQGSTFTIFIPLSIRRPASHIQIDITPQPHKVENHSQKHRLSALIVDDEQALRSLLSETLSHSGYNVDTASDGVECLAKLGKTFYDVMVLDLRMPRKEGIEVLETIKNSMTTSPKVIVISGTGNEDDLKASKEAGAFACIKKPFDVNKLLSVINEAVSTTETSVPPGFQ